MLPGTRSKSVRREAREREVAGIGAGSRESGGDDLWEITCRLYCADVAWHAKIKRNYGEKKKKEEEKED